VSAANAGRDVAPWAWLALAALVVALDQLSKAWAVQTLALHELRPVTAWFNLTLAYNTGAAFSVLSDAGGWQRGFFIVVSLALTALLLVWLWRARGERLTSLALALVIGGAVGNLVDRVRLGQVVDFIDWHARGWHWPAFNLADSAITVGVTTLVLASLFGGRRQDAGG
jgi:signal peptidase II